MFFVCVLSQVMRCLLALPEAYWKSILASQMDQISAYSQEGGHGGLVFIFWQVLLGFNLALPITQQFVLLFISCMWRC